jgi:hypothetical protein
MIFGEYNHVNVEPPGLQAQGGTCKQLVHAVVHFELTPPRVRCFNMQYVCSTMSTSYRGGCTQVRVHACMASREEELAR